MNNILMGMAILGIGLTSPAEEILKSPAGEIRWNVTIPEIKLSEAGTQDALGTLKKLALIQDADKLGFKGFVIIYTTPPPRKANLELNNVPFLQAVEYLSRSCGFNYEIQGDVIFIKNMIEIDSFSFPMSPRVKQAFGIQVGTKKQWIEAFEKLNIHTDSEALYIGNDTISISGFKHDIAYVRSVVCVLERGLNIVTPPK